MPDVQTADEVPSEQPAPQVLHETDTKTESSATLAPGDDEAAVAASETTPAVQPNTPDRHDSVPDPIPARQSIPAQTGREAMQGRAVRLYDEVAKSAGLKPVDLHADGEPISVDMEWVRNLRPAYMAADRKYLAEVKDATTRANADTSHEHRRAWDRARKEIGRAFGDLVAMYAADEIVDKVTGSRTGYRIYRLPDVLRQQRSHGAESVLPRPNGGRIVVDGEGRKVGNHHA